jgi:CubicO group peptidase (beta-lactamase class C family)
LPGYAHAVTIRQLLTHSSGLADYENCIPADHPTQIQDAQVPALLPADPQHGLFFVPGAGYRYSNTGYVLLALIAARVAGMPFPALLQQRIFAPLGMASSLAYCADGPPVPERAYGHTWDGSTWQCTDQSSTSATLGDGGIYASARDLARWLAALEEGLLLQPASLRAAITPWIATDDGRHYGFGWFIGEHRGGALVHHDGTTVGFRTAIVRLPERRRAAIVLTNRTHADPTRLALALLDRS